jgi:hypothetical protein
VTAAQDAARRYVIRRAWWIQPLVFLVGLVRDGNSYAAIEDGQLRVRCGWFFNQRFDLGLIESVEAISWPWYYGYGWRANFVGLVGVVANPRGVVAVRFRERQRVGGVLPLVKLPCDRLAISLEDPAGFMDSLEAHLGRSTET